LNAFSPRAARLGSVEDSGSVAVAELSDSEVWSGAMVDGELPVSSASGSVVGGEPPVSSASGSVVDGEPPASSASGSVAGVVVPDTGFVAGAVAPDSGSVADELVPERAAISGSLVTAVDADVSPRAASSADFHDWAALEVADGALAGDWLCVAVDCWTTSGLGVPPMGVTDMGLRIRERGTSLFSAGAVDS
jgi:hypothetical protein